jgi:putative transposase
LSAYAYQKASSLVPAKYRPELPVKGFAGLDVARDWAARFVHWYNHEHRHSGIGYVTPSQRHAGHDKALLMARHDLYQQARRSNPRRWSGQTRDWTPVAAVTLNPERDAIIRTTLSGNPLSGSIGAPAFPSRRATPGPRRATAEMGGAELPGASHSAP